MHSCYSSIGFCPPPFSRIRNSFSRIIHDCEACTRVQVSSYSGYQANERPASFSLEGHSYRVEEVLDQWHDPDGVYCKVRADDQNLYILRCHISSDTWSLESFRNESPG